MEKALTLRLDDLASGHDQIVFFARLIHRLTIAGRAIEDAGQLRALNELIHICGGRLIQLSEKETTDAISDSFIAAMFESGKGVSDELEWAMRESLPSRKE